MTWVVCHAARQYPSKINAWVHLIAVPGRGKYGLESEVTMIFAFVRRVAKRGEREFHAFEAASSTPPQKLITHR